MEPFARLLKQLSESDEAPPGAKEIMAALDRHTNKRTGRCCVSIPRLALRSKMSERTVLRMLLWLETNVPPSATDAHGWIIIERIQGRPNLYFLRGCDLHRERFEGRANAQATPDNLSGVTTDGTTDRITDRTTDRTTTTTSPLFVSGTPDNLSGVGAFSPCRPEQEQEERRESRSSPSRIANAPRTRSLFAEGQRRWLKAGADYLLAERPELAALRAWFPNLVAEFFLAQSWQRSSDPEAAVVWAKGLAAIAATEGETAAAFAWALATPSNVFSRPDHLRRIVGRIKSQRVQARVAEHAIEPTTDDRERARALLAEHLRKRGQEAKQ